MRARSGGRSTPTGTYHADVVNPLQWRSPAGETISDRVLLRPRRRARVHLGCGDVRLKGYLNVDYPSEQGVASGTSRPDVEADVTRLDAPPGRIAEIRLHHLFEHFERASALALLVRWYDWLEPGGRLLVETPDFDGCIAGFESRDLADQSMILRHLYGSQEAPWAQHFDGWSRGRFEAILPRLGYSGLTFEHGQSDERGLLCNVICHATKPATSTMPMQERVEAAREILKWSMNGDNQTERELLGRWEARLHEALRDQRAV